MVVDNGLHGDAIADDIFASDGDLQAFFHQAELEVAAGGRGGHEAAEEELAWLLNEDAFPTVETMEAVMKAGEPGQRRCHHCGTTKTPQWRQGPEGRGTLCNACGVRYRSGRLLPEYRPLNSPTFSPEAHSNKHRRVVEMRLCPGSSATDGLEVGAGEGAAAEELDWVPNKEAMETKPSVVGSRTMGVCTLVQMPLPGK